MRLPRPEEIKEKKMLLHYAHLMPTLFFSIFCYLGKPEGYNYLEMIRSDL
jgi:hypothetical protein